MYNPEIHHRKSIRLPDFDYASPGYYFITVCLNDLRCPLAFSTPDICRPVVPVPVVGVRHGESLQPEQWDEQRNNGDHGESLQDGHDDGLDNTCQNLTTLKKTAVGNIVEKFWNEIPAHYKNVELDEHVIMPDHVHGIIHLKKMPDDFYIPTCGNIPQEEICNGEPINRDSSGQQLVSSSIKRRKKNEFQHIIPKSIGIIVNQFKGAVNRWCKGNGFPQFNWQKDFYEQIIRTNQDLYRIRLYIRNNPRKFLDRSVNSG